MKFAALAVILTAAPLVALAAANSPDESFYRAAAEGGISEVDLGNLAQERTNDPKIKDFGAMMVKDHSAANDKLKTLASAKGVTLPEHGSIGQTATKAKLKVLSGDTFNKAYIKSQVKAHTETVALLRKEISTGQDADAKAFAQSILPTVRSHLKAIRTIAAEDNVKT
jgi:putative membrane protein